MRGADVQLGVLVRARRRSSSLLSCGKIAGEGVDHEAALEDLGVSVMSANDESDETRRDDAELGVLVRASQRSSSLSCGMMAGEEGGDHEAASED